MQKVLYPFLGNFPITFKFGESTAWYLKNFGAPHTGLDFGCPIGTPLFSVDDGEVFSVDKSNDANGMGLIVKHLWGYSLYWHLSVITAKVGQYLKAGDKLGLSGISGVATGAHLHLAFFTLNKNGGGKRVYFDPQPYLSRSIGETPIVLPKTRFYTVVSGDNLWKIAGKFYKTGALWEVIYNANRTQISNPNKIKVGQKLIIP